MHWPTWMDEAGLMAKSVEMGGDTLAQHTWQVLSRLSDQVRLRPQLPAVLGDDRLWTRMYWACFLHDFGKAATEFQGVLQKKVNAWKEYGQRHEILSLAFVDWLFPKGHIDREWIIAVIAFHHKDVGVIIEKYGGDKPYNRIDLDAREITERLLHHLAVQIDEETRHHLWRWIGECGVAWASSLQIPLLETPQLLPWADARTMTVKPAIFKALRTFSDWIKTTPESQKLGMLIIRGLIFTSDHSASAGAEPFPDMPLTWAIARRPLQGKSYRDHQQAAEQAPPGSAIMIAPTGSGKTEAALLWAARQMQYRPAARLFYTLPYQASMNAMYARLGKRYFDLELDHLSDAQKNRSLTIQHSRALLKLYQDMMEADERKPRDAAAEAKRLRNLARLNFFPIQIFSPYQMLKAAYSLKSYETLLLDYTDALFIFDEIHAYEPKRLALILTLMSWLRQHLGARFLVMTATLPPLVQEKLAQALNLAPEAVIQASKAEFDRSQRHTVHLLVGRLREQIVALVRKEVAEDKGVLVCVNRVADAQAVYELLRTELNLVVDEEIVLLHSRFNGEDRSRKEQILLRNAGVGVRHSGRRFVTVATQVVEVSLDVDFDTLYTDPAPLEALLQRFGRVNRGRVQPPDHPPAFCPVYVFSEPSSVGKDPYKPYEAEMVERSLHVLETICGSGRPIDESLVTGMLDKIYQGEIATHWQAAYHESANEFQSVILDKMKPFESADESMWRKFYKMFDGVEVLPVEYEARYSETRQRNGYLAASRYVVNISSKNYAEFKGYGLIVPAKELEKDALYDQIDVPYDPETGLALDQARQAQKARRQSNIAVFGEDDE